MKGKRLPFLIIICLILSVLTKPASAETSIPQQDQTPLAPLTSPPTPSAAPRYISGFGMDNSYTVFYEDRNDAAGCAAGTFRIHFISTTNGPLNFAAASTATNICDSHFTVKNWPITSGGTTYAYRGWGAGNYSGSHHFYVSNDLINWALIATFTFFHPSDGILYGFHDILQLNGHYMGFVESAGGHTYIVSSPTGDQNWSVAAQVGGSGAADTPLNLSFTSAGPIPSGDFLLMQVGGQRVYGKLMMPGNRSGAYLAINPAAAQALTPAAAEAAFLDPANWTWANGSTGLPTAASRVLTSTLGAGGHDIRETWTVPASDPNLDNVILYTGNYVSTGSAPGLGCAANNAQCLVNSVLPMVVNINSVTDTGDGQLGEGELVIVPITQLIATFNKDLNNPAGDTAPADVTNTANYLLVGDNGDGIQTLSCRTGVTGGDEVIPINSVSYTNNGGGGPFAATLSINGGTPLANNVYRLIICGTTSVRDLAGTALAGDGATAGTDFIRNFSLFLGAAGNAATASGSEGSLPLTGFAPGRFTELSTLPHTTYNATGGLILEIPTLHLKLPIVGIPFKNGTWDVNWLLNETGWLEKTAFPGFEGNSVLTGHVTLSYGQPGPFANLNQLRVGEYILVHAFGTVYVYQVNNVRKTAPNDLSVFRHEDKAWLTLITCSDYNESLGTYAQRLVVRSRLVETLSEDSWGSMK